MNIWDLILLQIFLKNTMYSKLSDIDIPNTKYTGEARGYGAQMNIRSKWTQTLRFPLCPNLATRGRTHTTESKVREAPISPNPARLGPYLPDTRFDIGLAPPHGGNLRALCPTSSKWINSQLPTTAATPRAKGMVEVTT